MCLNKQTTPCIQKRGRALVAEVKELMAAGGGQKYYIFE